MPTPLFSINSAAEVLERDRRTVTKALRHTPPDAKQKGQPRWRLRTILDALDELPGSSKAPKRVSYVSGGREYVGQIFRCGECFGRANDALLALGEMLDDQQLRWAEFGRVFDLIENLRSAFAEVEPPEGQPEVIGYMLGRMIKGLLFATGVRITDDDGTPFVAEKDIRAYEPPADDMKR
jgi:hypothetical protein